MEPEGAWRVKGEEDSPGPETGSCYGFDFRVHSVTGHGQGKGDSTFFVFFYEVGD